VKSFLFCILWVVLFLDCTAQNYTATLRTASYLYHHQRYREAIPLLEEVLVHNPDEANAKFMLGKSYLFCFSYPEALMQLKQAFELNPQIDPEILFWLGYANHLNYNFKNAEYYYKQYQLTLHKSDPRYDVSAKSILESQYGIKYYANPVFCEIKNLGPKINSKYSDHSPVITQDGKTMYFTSRRGMDSTAIKDIYGEYAEDIFLSHLDASGNWEAPIYSGINTDEHDAVIQLYKDTIMVMYRNLKMGDIYTVTMRDSVWSSPVIVPGVNTDYTETSLFFSDDGSKMFLSTDRESIRADFDLYVADKKADGTWGEFVNMGDSINTDYDENSPYVSADGNTLFFSSNGHTSMGGYDIFRSEFDTTTKQWGKPINLGYPFNTPGDDIYFYYANEESLSGYFSSYRIGGYGEKDIYEVTFTPTIAIDGEVIDIATNLPIDSVDLAFCHTIQDSIHHPLYVKDRVEDNTGKYNVNLLSAHKFTVYLIHDGDTLARGVFRTPKISLGAPVHYSYKVRVDKEKGIIEGEQIDIVKADSPIAGESTSPDVTAVAAPTFGVKKPHNVSASYLAETTTGTTPASGVNTTRNNKGVKYVSETNTGTASAEYFGIKEVMVGCGGILRNIYFDFNSAQVDLAKSQKDLDNLLCFLKENPSYKIEISGHTDNIGSPSYNKDLSQRRAQAIVNYLIAKGVSRKRLVAVGYGEERPIATNDDELEGREYNRRTEFKLISKNK
jgi:outer membrane protein OmpA-like peptidoglycan-associated protein